MNRITSHKPLHPHCYAARAQLSLLLYLLILMCHHYSCTQETFSRMFIHLSHCDLMSSGDLLIIMRKTRTSYNIEQFDIT